MAKKSKSKTGDRAIDATIKKLGATNFKPCEGEFDAKEFSEMMENHRVNGHLAMAVMHSSKERIMDGFREVPETMTKMTLAISDSIEGLRAIVSSMEVAHLRLISSCAAVHSK